MSLPVIWVPGHLCGAWLYAPQLAVFGGGRETIMADTLSDDSLGAMAGRLLAGAPERFVVAGLSMGGMVAMEAMARAPERVAGAVLMDTDPSRARERDIVAGQFHDGSESRQAGRLRQKVHATLLPA